MDNLKELLKRASDTPVFKSPQYQKYQVLIVPMTVLVLAILISVLVTVPQFLRLLQAFQTMEELNQKKTFLENKIGELEAVNVEENQKDLDTALVALPVNKDIPGVMGQLLVALSSSGMSLEGISFSSGPPESEKVEEFLIRMDVEGTEENLKNFLERVQLSPRIVKLSGIDISKSPQSEISATISFATFYQSLPSNIGAVDKPVPKITPADIQQLADIRVKVGALPQVTQESSTSAAIGKLDPFR